MKVKTSDLIGAALDWVVYIKEGETDTEYSHAHMDAWAFSTDWSQGGPIIERENINIAYMGDCSGEWCADSTLRQNQNRETYCEYGPTPLIAAMRCYVASKLGEEVDIPQELLP